MYCMTTEKKGDYVVPTITHEELAGYLESADQERALELLQKISKLTDLERNELRILLGKATIALVG